MLASTLRRNRKLALGGLGTVSALGLLGGGLLSLLGSAWRSGPVERTAATSSAPILSRHRSDAAVRVARRGRALRAAEDRAERRGPLSALLAETEQEKRLVHGAEEVAIAQCMRQKGFEYAPNPYVPARELTPSPRGYASGESTRGSGYGLAAALNADPAARPPNPNSARIAQRTPAEQRAWHEALKGPGHPVPDPDEPIRDPSLGIVSIPGGLTMTWNRDSCLTRGLAAIHGGDEHYARITLGMNALMHEAREHTRSDPEYRATLGRWQACMRDRGLYHDSPEGIVAALSSEHRSGRLTTQEVAQREAEAANADADCAMAVNLSATRQAARVSAELAVAERNSDLVREYEEYRRQMLHRARRIAGFRAVSL